GHNYFVQGSAALTHYWQNYPEKSADFFKEEAEQLLTRLEEPEVNNYELPFEYDVPVPPPRKVKFTFIDLFAGIGGFRIGFQNHGGKCVFTSEWDKWAQKTYEANFGEVPFGDITQIDENKIPDHDILLAGFPCQPFSLAGVSKKKSLGRQHGFLDEAQGTLFFDVARIIDAKRPKTFVLENVKNLRSHDGGNTFRTIKKTLESLDYKIFAQIIDAKEYVPQHRERIFIVGFDRESYGKDIEFQFPEKTNGKHQLNSILEKVVEDKYTLTENLWNYLQNYAAKHKAKGNGFGFGMPDLTSTSRTLSARYHKDGSEILIRQSDGKRPRRLTPEECKRLMGYPPEYVIKDIGVSDTQLYRQFGNSVVVPVVESIASKVLESMNEIKSIVAKRLIRREQLLKGLDQSVPNDHKDH
ncbi:DNA (cytosine-5-)-methyltransferase, partial [Crocinitomix catalasitica]|nr:DNA (cytosine-5-)-methyltransferase [Crocinitomix catalasitica]